MAASTNNNLSPRAFRRIQTLFERESGIRLSDSKQPLVASRLRKRVEHHALQSFDAYCDFVDGNEGASEQRLLVDLLTTNETYFFREPRHFQHLAQNVLPALCTESPRIWCAAASSGEEPYSIAMTLDSRSDDWELLATDLSRRVLDRAQRALYPIDRLDHMPREHLKRYCLRGTGEFEGMLRVRSELRERVRFAEHNLMHPARGLGQFDVIFLRNVLIYFENEAKIRIVREVLQALRPGGWLYVGRSETLHGLGLPLDSTEPSIYRKRQTA
jgi:chemotaxis protein methyltransferase CheR